MLFALKRLNPMNKIASHALTLSISVAISFFIIKPQAEVKAVKAVERAMKCEQMLITGNIEPMCAGYLAMLGFDVEGQAVLYSPNPYNATQMDVLPQLGKVKRKPD